MQYHSRASSQDHLMKDLVITEKKYFGNFFDNQNCSFNFWLPVIKRNTATDPSDRKWCHKWPEVYIKNIRNESFNVKSVKIGVLELPRPFKYFCSKISYFFDECISEIFENSNIWKSESQVKMSRYEPLFKCELKDTVLFSFSDLLFLGNYSTDKNHKINSLDFRWWTTKFTTSKW